MVEYHVLQNAVYMELREVEKHSSEGDSEQMSNFLQDYITDLVYEIARNRACYINSKQHEENAKYTGNSNALRKLLDSQENLEQEELALTDICRSYRYDNRGGIKLTQPKNDHKRRKASEQFIRFHGDRKTSSMNRMQKCHESTKLKVQNAPGSNND